MVVAMSFAAMSLSPASSQETPNDIGGSWVKAVHFRVARSTGRISRQLRNGVYVVHFFIGPNGAASGFAIRGSRPEPAQYALLTGALALTSFPPPPDGLGHPIDAPIVVRNNGRIHRQR